MIKKVPPQTAVCVVGGGLYFLVTLTCLSDQTFPYSPLPSRLNTYGVYYQHHKRRQQAQPHAPNGGEKHGRSFCFLFAVVPQPAPHPS